jgi:hypothetical protein
MFGYDGETEGPSASQGCRTGCWPVCVWGGGQYMYQFFGCVYGWVGGWAGAKGGGGE